MSATIRNLQTRIHPAPFADGHALTFTLREIHDPVGEFLSQYHEREAAIRGFTLAQKYALYAELRDKTGEVIADFTREGGAHWYMHTCHALAAE